METCGHEGCERLPTDMLVWRPGEMQVLNGSFSVAVRCREHSVIDLAEHLHKVDPQAKIWTLLMNGHAPLVPALYLLSKR